MLSFIGEVNRYEHFRKPTPLDQQHAIRLNRDTLYSAAIVDICNGATVTIPDSDGRYMTMMVINGEHYINRVFSEPGTYRSPK